MRASILQKCHLAKIMVHLFRMTIDKKKEKKEEEGNYRSTQDVTRNEPSL